MDALSSLLCGTASVSLAAAAHAISATSASTGTPPPAAVAWALVGASAAVSPLLIILPVAGRGPPSIRGALSGAVLSLSCLLSAPAARRLGSAPAAAALAAAAASLSSFFASVGPAGDWSRAADVAILRPGLAAPGLVALLLGGAACAASSRRDLASAAAADVVERSVSLLEGETEEGEEIGVGAGGGDEEEAAHTFDVLLGHVPAASAASQERDFWEGLALSSSAGLLAGSSLLPMRAAPAPLRGLSFLPSVALGALVAGPSSAALLLHLSGESGATAAPRAVRSRCALAGALLAAAAAAAIVAVSRSRGGLAAVCPAVAIGFAVAVSAIEVAAVERRGRAGWRVSASGGGGDSSLSLSPTTPTAIISRPRSFALSLAALAVGAGLLSASV